MGVALASPDLTEQVTRHSLRATGAQGLAKAGLDEWAIQLLGRWGSQAVRAYTREAALEASATWARRAVLGRPTAAGGIPTDVGKLRRLIKELLGESLSTFSPGLREGQAAEIRDDVLRALREAQTPPVASSPSSSSLSPPPAEPTVDRFIKNVSTGVFHLSRTQPEGRLATWSTECGWRYAARSNADYVSVFEPPGMHKFIYEKCLPHVRQDRKRELQQAMRRQGGEH